MKKVPTIGIVIVVGVVALLLLHPFGVNAPEPSASATPSIAPSSSVSPSISPSPVAGSVKTFTITSSHVAYDIRQITVKKGDTVRIIFKNDEGFHDWVVDEFNARTPRIPAGQTAEVQFVADKTGSFQFYCSVGDHRARGMWGTLTVQ